MSGGVFVRVVFVRVVFVRGGFCPTSPLDMAQAWRSRNTPKIYNKQNGIETNPKKPTWGMMSLILAQYTGEPGKHQTDNNKCIHILQPFAI